MGVDRTSLRSQIEAALARSPVVALIGPRQSGKTTLAREFVPMASANYFDLEDPVSLSRLDEPMTSLAPLDGLVVIDEIQRRPELFPVLRVLVDRTARPGQFLILGSASGELLRQSSESLAGRIERVQVSGFTLDELGADALRQLWVRGGLPRAFLADSDVASVRWRKEYVQSLLEREFPLWGIRIPAATLHRFWSVLSHYHGQLWNGAELARTLQVSESTGRRYLDLLTDALLVRQLQPWHTNTRKRQVRSPKVYLRDSGLFHQLAGIADYDALVHHPKIGASWEGLVIEQILASEEYDEAAFWATHQGAEIDLLLRRGDRLFGVECKRADAPRITRSMRIALEDLGLEHIAVLYPGERRYPLAEQVEAVPLAALQVRGRLFDAF